MANPHEWLDRKPGFPLHHIITGKLPRRKAAGGRIIQGGGDQDRYAAGGWEATIGGLDKLLAVVTKEDVVYVPLWQGCLNGKCRDASAKWRSPSWKDLCSFVKDLAPQCGAVLLGNAGVELTFWQPAQNRHGYIQHMPEMLGFVDACAEVVCGAGGRPAFGTVDWDLAFDCYGDGRLAAKMSGVGALQLCFCGYTLIPESWCDRTADLYSRQLAFLMERERKEPFIKLMRYFDGLDVWSGCNGKDGLRHGNDWCLSKYNFRAGFYRP